MTKLYAKVRKLRDGAAQALKVAQMYGQGEASGIWKIRHECYNQVLDLIGDPEVTPGRWKRLICKVFHQRYSLKCPNCGGGYL